MDECQQICWWWFTSFSLLTGNDRGRSPVGKSGKSWSSNLKWTNCSELYISACPYDSTKNWLKYTYYWIFNGHPMVIHEQLSLCVTYRKEKNRNSKLKIFDLKAFGRNEFCWSGRATYVLESSLPRAIDKLNVKLSINKLDFAFSGRNILTLKGNPSKWKGF